MCQDTELDAFKREIDLRQFAVTLGYAMDRRESWRGSTVLRRGGDKILEAVYGENAAVPQQP